MYYIYEIFNDVTQKRYIGVSKNPMVRFQHHLTSLRNHTHSAEGMNKDYIRFGEEHFVFRFLDMADSKTDGLLLERKYILKSQSYVPEYGYNGNDPRWNRKHPPKAIEDSEIKKSISAKGYKLSEISWLLDIPYSIFVTKMNHQELFTEDEMRILNDLIKYSPSDWFGRQEYKSKVIGRRML